mmetsp:Transcript_21293/g.60789  ORF Transcript_21293/g.60789 Transcript_21293/m.60789 type:complete len:238 (-) Transcript_21293:547-1260(-)
MQRPAPHEGQSARGKRQSVVRPVLLADVRNRDSACGCRGRIVVVVVVAVAADLRRIGKGGRMRRDCVAGFAGGGDLANLAAAVARDGVAASSLALTLTLLLASPRLPRSNHGGHGVHASWRHVAECLRRLDFHPPLGQHEELAVLRQQEPPAHGVHHVVDDLVHHLHLVPLQRVVVLLLVIVNAPQKGLVAGMVLLVLAAAAQHVRILRFRDEVHEVGLEGFSRQCVDAHGRLWRRW